MHRVRILPYKMASGGAKRLQEALQDKGINCLRVYPDGDYTPRIGDLIVLWGHGGVPGWWNHTKGIRVLNHPESICKAIHKPTALKIMESLARTVPWTTSRAEAQRWADKGRVCVRYETEGMDGSGLELMHGELPAAPLYTKFIEAQQEYRVHIFGERAIIWQRKGPGEGENILSPYIRASTNGYAFFKTPMKDMPEEALEQSVLAVKALGLDFGGVDVLWDGEKAYVLEVNTAPDIRGTDVDTYRDCILNMVQE